MRPVDGLLHWLVSMLLIAVSGCTLDDRGQATQATTSPSVAATISPTVTVTRTATMAVAMPQPREYVLALTGTPLRVQGQYGTLARLMENPNMTDARWRTEVRDTATDIKRLAA